MKQLRQKFRFQSISSIGKRVEIQHPSTWYPKLQIQNKTMQMHEEIKYIYDNISTVCDVAHTMFDGCWQADWQ